MIKNVIKKCCKIFFGGDRVFLIPNIETHLTTEGVVRNVNSCIC